MEIAVLMWFALCVAVAILANRYERSVIGWFLTSLVFSPLIGAAFVLALGPLTARPAYSAGYQPITEHAPPKAEEAPMSMIDAYRKACVDREMRRTHHYR